MRVYAYFVGRAALSGLFEDWPEQMGLAVVIAEGAEGGLSSEVRMVLFHSSQSSKIIEQIAGDAGCEVADVRVCVQSQTGVDCEDAARWTPEPTDEKWIIGQIKARKTLEEDAIDTALNIEFARSEGLDPTVLMASPESGLVPNTRPSWKSVLAELGSLVEETPLKDPIDMPSSVIARVEPPVASPVKILEPVTSKASIDEDIDEPEVLGYFSPTPDILSACRMCLATLRIEETDLIFECVDAEGRHVPEIRAPFATLIGEDLSSFLMPPGLGRSWSPEQGLCLRLPGGMLPSGFAASIIPGTTARIASTPWAVHVRLLEMPPFASKAFEAKPVAKAGRHLLRSAAIGAALGLALAGAAAGIAWTRPGETRAFLEQASGMFGINPDWVGRMMSGLF